MNVKEISESALLGQRWYAGKARRLVGVDAAEVVEIPGDGAALVLADARYEDGAGERYVLLEGAPDWPAVLRAGAVEGTSGRLELRPGEGLEALLPAPGTPVSEPSTDQTNTLLRAGRLLLKLYRRVEPGVHPEVEVLQALCGTEAPVPGYAGALWYVDGAGETAIALLQEYVEGAESGWEAPIERAAAWLRAPSSTSSIVAEHRELGRCAAQLRDGLAAAFGRLPAPPGIGARWHEEALALLATAATLDAAAADPRIAERLGPLCREGRGLELARVHGDLHVAQILRTAEFLRVIDFEGDPTLPLEVRRRHDTPLRDLACLLRSVDHVGQAAARRVPGVDAASQERWIGAAGDGVLEGWGEPVDPALLHALELAKACQELVYANRVLPEWAYAPRAGLGRLLERGPA